VHKAPKCPKFKRFDWPQIFADRVIFGTWAFSFLAKTQNAQVPIRNLPRWIRKLRARGGHYLEGMGEVTKIYMSHFPGGLSSSRGNMDDERATVALIALVVTQISSLSERETSLWKSASSISVFLVSVSATRRFPHLMGKKDTKPISYR
jgi:hypothetical protein